MKAKSGKKQGMHYKNDIRGMTPTVSSGGSDSIHFPFGIGLGTRLTSLSGYNR